MKFDFIIVLCPSVRNFEGYFAQFENGKYLGGQIRMDAVVKLAQENNNTTFILVGGYNEDDGVDDSHYYQKSQKTEDMKNYLLENKTNTKKIKIVNSLPCTKHNLVAVFNKFKKELSNKKSNIGLLTNSYHLPRALSFWTKLRLQDNFQIIIEIPQLIEAESIIGGTKDDRYSTFFPYISRLESELKGLVDIEREVYQKGAYNDNCINKKGKLPYFEKIINEHFNQAKDKNDLLTFQDIEDIKSKSGGS